MAAALRAEGVDVRLGAALDAVAAAGDAVALHVGDRDESTPWTSCWWPPGGGRTPRTSGLESVGLAAGRAARPWTTPGWSHGVDGQWLYAAGDVTGRAPLTHQGKYDARIAGAAIAARADRHGRWTPAPWGEHAATADHAAVPQVVFTDPEVAAVGLTAGAGPRAGLDVRVVDLPIAVGGSTLQADGYDGAARLVVDREREVLVGATFVGQDVAEMIHAATVAVVGEVPMARLWHAVPAYPTISEVWLRLLESYRSEA